MLCARDMADGGEDGAAPGEAPDEADAQGKEAESSEEEEEVTVATTTKAGNDAGKAASAAAASAVASDGPAASTATAGGSAGAAASAEETGAAAAAATGGGSRTSVGRRTPEESKAPRSAVEETAQDEAEARRARRLARDRGAEAERLDREVEEMEERWSVSRVGLTCRAEPPRATRGAGLRTRTELSRVSELSLSPS